MTDETPGPDQFEIIRTIRSMRRLKPDPAPNELVWKIMERRKFAALAVPGTLRSAGQGDGRGLWETVGASV